MFKEDDAGGVEIRRGGGTTWMQWRRAWSSRAVVTVDAAMELMERSLDALHYWIRGKHLQ